MSWWDDWGADVVKGVVGVALPPVGVALAADAALNDGDIGDTLTGTSTWDEGDPGTPEDPNAKDTTSSPMNNFGIQGTNWGGYEGAARDFSNIGLGRMGQNDGFQSWAQGQASTERGPQAWENQELSDNEAYTRGYDQSGAVQLAREAAMGNSPSAAAYQMQRGLDQSLASQQAQIGSARGAAGMALAGGNAAANSANLMNQTYNQAGQLRAQEMAQAMGLYGGLSGQMREQDLQRLGQGNQMAQYNAGLNDQYRLGMSGVGQQYGNLGLGYYNAAQNPYNQQMNSENQAYDRGFQGHEGSANRAVGVSKTNMEQENRDDDRTQRYVGMGVDLVGKGIGAAA